MDKQKNSKKKRSGLPTHMGLVFRTVAGGYLVYLAYSIYSGSGEIQGAEKIAFTAAIILFALVGAVVIFSSLRAMQRGEYEGGAGDPGKKSVSVEEEEEAAKPDRIRFGEIETLPEAERENDEKEYKTV